MTAKPDARRPQSRQERREAVTTKTRASIDAGVSPMREALQKAFEAASRLPDGEQDELAAAILEELRADELCEVKLEKSRPALERLAEEAREEYRAGRTEPLDRDAL